MSGFHIEAGGYQYAAAIDARQRASQRRHDMAAGVTLKQSLTEPIRIIRWGKVRVFSVRERKNERRDMAAGATRTLIQYPKTINDNSWYINGNSCKTNN